MNSKKIIVLSACWLAITSCSPLIKKLAGIKNPRVETKESITNFLTKAKIPLQNSYIINCLDSTRIYENLLLGLKGEILLFDSMGIKYCYKGKDKCTGKQLKQAYHNFHENYQPCRNDSNTLSSILSNTSRIKNELRPPTNYYIVVFWAKFAKKKSKLADDYAWLLSLKNNSDLSPTILFINTDLQEDWGLKRRKKVRLKFKLMSKKSAAIHFGSLPYKK